MPDQVGDVVARCDFESTFNPEGLFTGCPGIEFSQAGDTDFDVASSSASADTGPSADHTGGGGKCYNGICSRGKKTVIF